MPLHHITILVLTLTTHIIFPLAFIIWVWRSKNECKLDWLIKLLLSASYMLLLFIVGYWIYTSYYLRYVWIILLVFSMCKSYFNAKYLPFYTRKVYVDLLWTIVLLALSCTFIYQSFNAIAACIYNEEPVNLSFPLKGGVYVITDGGNGLKSPLMNYHYALSFYATPITTRSMTYAVDISQLNDFGASAYGILPNDIEKYAIYNEAVYSPCDGEVVDVVDGFANEIPYSDHYSFNSANTIIIKSNDIYVTLGHLQRGSITVKLGDKVKIGQSIARVGNSGRSSEPHLHVQAIKKPRDSEWIGDSVPVLFDGKVPAKNRLFFR